MHLGFLVVDYLNSECDPKAYLETVSQHSSDYNGFRMIGLQVSSDGVKAAVYSNFENRVIQLSSGKSCTFSNISIDLHPIT